MSTALQVISFNKKTWFDKNGQKCYSNSLLPKQFPVKKKKISSVTYHARDFNYFHMNNTAHVAPQGDQWSILIFEDL